MFGSNVQPKRKVAEKPAAWSCGPCDKDYPGYMTRCQHCAAHRPKP